MYVKNMKNASGPQRNWNHVLVSRVDPYIRSVPKGESVMRLRLNGQSVNLLPFKLAQRTKTLTLERDESKMRLLKIHPHLRTARQRSR